MKSYRKQVIKAHVPQLMQLLVDTMTWLERHEKHAAAGSAWRVMEAALMEVETIGTLGPRDAFLLAIDVSVRGRDAAKRCHGIKRQAKYQGAWNAQLGKWRGLRAGAEPANDRIEKLERQAEHLSRQHEAMREAKKRAVAEVRMLRNEKWRAGLAEVEELPETLARAHGLMAEMIAEAREEV